MKPNLELLPSDVLDAMPWMVFLVDDDVQILYANVAAQCALGGGMEFLYERRGGDVLHCLNSLTLFGGCGRGPGCKECAVRNSVGKTVSGQKVTRLRTKMRLQTAEGVKDSYFLVTTAPFVTEGHDCVLLTMEDVNEIMDLRSLLPVCSHCKKIRADRQYWEHVDQFLQRHRIADITHGICPDCIKQHYSEDIAREVLTRTGAATEAGVSDQRPIR
jgi:hypothetical protein